VDKKKISKRRINITIHGDNVSDERAVGLVWRVIGDGRVSNRGAGYCYVTTFENQDTGVRTTVQAEKTKAGSDTFAVYIEPYGGSSG